jgi:pilus assembly protein CpaE
MTYQADEKLEREEAEMHHASPRILVLDRRGELATELARAVAAFDPAPEVLRLPRPTTVVEVAETQRPDVIVAAPEEMTHAGLRRLAQVHRANPRAVILLSPNGRVVSVKEAAACGVSDVLPYPSTPARMRVKLRRAIETAEELRAERIIVHETVREVPAPAAAVPSQTAHVLTVTSATGGCGKTFFATNVAAYLAKAKRSRVLLVDLDLQFGEVAVSLRLRPERTIAELTEEDDVATALPDYVVRHADGGYDVLCAPKDPVAAERVGPREATAVLEAAERLYDHVVVDTPPALNEVVLAAFDRSKALVVMATMDVPSLRNLRVFLETLDRLKIDPEQVSLVLNKEEQGTGIDIRQIERVYPQGFAAVLPHATEVTRSLNQGTPVLCLDAAAEISRRLADGLHRLYPPDDGVELPWTGPGAGERRSWISRFLRKGAQR